MYSYTNLTNHEFYCLVSGLQTHTVYNIKNKLRNYFISFCKICSSSKSFGRVLVRCSTTLSSSITLDGNLLSESKAALPFLSSVFLNVLRPLWLFCGPWRTSASVSSRQLKLRCFLVRVRSFSSLCSRHWATMEALSFKLLSPNSWSRFSLSRSFSSSALALWKENTTSHRKALVQSKFKSHAT